MEEAKKASDTEIEIALRRQLFETKRKQIYEDLQKGSVDLTKLNKYGEIFSDGMKEGTVRFEPHQDGTASLFVDIVTSSRQEKETKELRITDKGVVGYLNGLQSTLTPPKPPEVK